MTDRTTLIDEHDLDDETVDAVVHEDEATDPPTDDEPAEAGDLVVRDQQPEHVSAIERAAEMAIENPGIPGRDEFLSLAAQARILCMSAAAPKAVQNDPHLAFHVAMIGRDLRISPSAALELIDVIEGGRDKPPQLSLSPQLLNGQIRRLGLGSIVPAIKTDRVCVAVVLGPDGRLDPRCKRTWPDHWTSPHDPTIGCECRDQIGDYEFTWEDAQMAGLASADCQPGEHTADCRNWNRGKFCNQGYKTYPKRMLWWRASGFAADDYFPEAGLGLYTAEELGAVVDADGRPVDPATVELPPGFEPAELPAAKENPAADPEIVAALKERIGKIKAVAGAPDALREVWIGPGGTDDPRLPPLPKIRASDVTKADAAVKSIEQRIAAGEFGEQPADESEPETDDDSSGDAEPDEPESSGDPLVDEVVAEVRAMELVDVIDALGHRRLTVRGDENDKRRRLAQALYEDRIAAPAAADGESGDGAVPADTETGDGDTDADPEQQTLDG